MNRQNMGFAPSISGWLDRTNRTRLAIVTMLESGRVRLASRFFLGISPTNDAGFKNEKIDLPGFLKNLGLDYYAPAPIARVIMLVASAMGLTYTQAEVESILVANGYNPNEAKPINTIIRDILKLNIDSRKGQSAQSKSEVAGNDSQRSKRGRRGSRGRNKGKRQDSTNTSTPTPLATIVAVTPSITVMKFDLVSSLMSWFTGTSNRSVKPANVLGMRLYTVAPSTRDNNVASARSICTFDVLVIGDTLVVYGWSRESVNALPFGSKTTLHDIPSSTHSAPFTTMLHQLVKNGYAKLADFGIMDAQAFTAEAFEYGLATVIATWFNAIKAMNKANDKIAAGMNKVQVAKGPVNAATIAQIASASTQVYDGVQGELPVESFGRGSRELVGAGIGSSGFGSTSDFGHSH
jgi:hypothetical protein